MEVTNRDDLDTVGMVHLRHDGRLPLQVLGDVGVLDLVKCHHLQGHLLVQNDVVSQVHIAKGGWGQLVVTDWTGKIISKSFHGHRNHHNTNHCHNLYLRTRPPREDTAESPPFNSAEWRHWIFAAF